ncbi:MAG: Maf family protein [Anaerovoracaceae bacterium]|jgi:septum formation protein
MDIEKVKQNIVLASGSPRRIEMMQENGFRPQVMPSGIRENLPPFLTPREATMFLAMSKAFDVRSRLAPDDERLIVAADTVVVFEGRILGKPADPAQAKRMLLPMSGKKHEVITGVCLAFAGKSLSKCFAETSSVYFKELPVDEIEAYVGTDEPYDKAGGYAIQGTFARYTDHIEGDRNNIIGFPWNAFMRELRSL